MAIIDVIDKERKKIEELNLKDDIFNITVHDQVIYDAIRHYKSKKRLGTASVLRRAEVSGTGAKHHRQKGTGMARAGSARVPHWRGGGSAFGPKPRDFTKRINKKVKRMALKGILSDKYRDKRIFVIEDLSPDIKKTNEFEKMIEKYGDFVSILLVLPEYNENLFKVARNISWITLMTSKYLNTYECLLADNILFTKSAIQKFQEEIK